MDSKPTYEDLERMVINLRQELSERRESEKALRRSEEKYRNIFESIGEVYYEIDLAGNLTFFNEALVRLHRRTREEMMGLNNRDYTSPETAKRVFKIFNEIYREEGLPTRIIDYEIIRKDGSIIMAELSASLLIDESGRKIGFHGIVRDRTDQKKAEKALEESEEKYRNILETMEEIYYEVDMAGNLSFFNPTLNEAVNRPPEALIGLNFREYTTPEASAKIFSIFSEVLGTGISKKIVDYEVVRTDGVRRILEGYVSLKKNAHGKPIGFRGILRDVTEQKKAEKALQQSEENLRITLNSIGDAVIATDINGSVVRINPVAETLTGWKQKEALGKPLSEIFHIILEESKEKIESPVDRVLRDGNIVDLGNHVLLLSKDGTERPVADSAAPIRDTKGKLTGVVLVFRDVTQKRKDEQALRESEEKYRTILETMEEGYYETDLAGNRTFRNEAMGRISGYSHDEAMEMTPMNNTPHESLKILREVYAEVYRTGIPAKIPAREVSRKDGSVIVIESNLSLKRDPLGKPIGFRCIVIDITEQKKVKEALRQSEEKYRLLVENAHDAIFILQDGVVKFSNSRTEALTGYSAEELANMPFMNLVHYKDKEAFVERQLKLLTGDYRPGTISFQMINRKDEILWVELDAVGIRWEGHPAALHFLRDITTQKKMEDQLLQAQKMEAIGTLAGGIAHDFNNLLMGIQGNTSLILLDIGGPNHPYYSKLKNIEQQVQAGAELTRQMLGVAKGGKYDVKATNINKLIEEVLDLFGRTRKEIAIHKFLLEEVWTVEVDRNQIEQVLLNLYVNAGHAMPSGGDLYVETKNITLDENYTSPLGLSPGKFVRISVTDTGIGMDETTQKRAFDPFFTTKEMGRGTGLGLASAYGIVKNHNGIINIYSQKGQGTTFNIYLPVTEKNIAQETNVPAEILKGTETILFVDDQEVIADIGQSLLQQLGYHVIAVRSGSEAIEVYRREGSRIDLVILDMIMPEMGGGETFDRMKEIDPQVKVILSSGYSINGQAKNILDRGCKGFLQKPFSLADLSKKVRQVLDEKEG